MQGGGLQAILDAVIAANAPMQAAAVKPLIHRAGTRNLNLNWTRASDIVSQYVSGYPVLQSDAEANLTALYYAFGAAAEAISEALTLVTNNAGTIRNVSTNVQNKVVRQFS
jgi:hypothetical protein